MTGDAINVPDRPPVPRDQTFWLSREDWGDEGLAPEIEVWLVRPEPEYLVDGGVVWLPPLELVDIQDTYYGYLTPAQCRREIGTAPETARELIRVERGTRAKA